MKRVFFFVATNLAILLLLGVVLIIFGLDGRRENRKTLCSSA